MKKLSLVFGLFLLQTSSFFAMDKWAALMPKIDRLPQSSKEWVHNACGDPSGWSAANHKELYPFCFATIKITTEINERLLNQQKKQSSTNP
jgi:hypothetical protein